MLVRFVKMYFKKENIASFEALFQANSGNIRNFKGCHYLALYKDAEDPSVFMTHSMWSSADALENYRNSKLFREVWDNAKKHFSSKPEAWSMETLATLK